jgi:hypothetical protein
MSVQTDGHASPASNGYEDDGEDDKAEHARRWPYAVFAVALLVLLYLVIYRMTDPRLTLDYLRALIWPALLGAALFWLRVPLRSKVADLIKVGVGPAQAEFANRNLERGLAEPTATVLKKITASDEGHLTLTSEGNLTLTGDIGVGSTTADGPADPNKASKDGEDTSDAQLQGDGKPDVAASQASDLAHRHAIQRRWERIQEQKAIEKIIEESAAWGYDMAKAGAKSYPIPTIDWTPAGRPLITLARVPGSGEGRSHPGVANREVRRAILERELTAVDQHVQNALNRLPATKGMEATEMRQDLEEAMTLRNQLSNELARLGQAP